MSIYLGLPVDKKRSLVSPELEAKGIQRIRAPPSSIRSIAIPTMVQTAFLSYITLLPAFMWSLIKSSKADVRHVGHPLIIIMKECFSIGYPSVSVTLKESDAEREQALLDQGAEVNMIYQKKVFIFKNPSVELLKVLMADKNIVRTAPSPDEIVNLDSLTTFRNTIQIFSEFFKVHRYPAYLDPSHTWDHLPDRSLDFSEDAEAGEKRKRGSEDDVQEQEAKRIKGDRAHVMSVGSSHKDLPSAPGSKGREAIMRIKTIPTPAVHPWANSTADLPATWGIWAPYIPSLQTFDRGLVPDVVKRYFVQCLGSSRDSCLAGYERFRSDWGCIGDSQHGKILTHMAYFIDLSLCAQARPIPLFLDGRYAGIFISGCGFKIDVAGVSYVPQSFDKILKEIEESSTHRRVLATILGLLGKTGDADDGMTEIGGIIADKSFSMMKLHDICVAAKITGEDKSKVQELAARLDFHHATWGINANEISRALSMIVEMNTPLSKDLPIHHSVLFERDRLDLVWSCFGFIAPSFRPPEGLLVSIKAKKYEIEVNSKEGKRKESRDFDRYHVKPTALEKAIRDMKEVRKNGTVGILRTLRREATYSDRLFAGKDFGIIHDGMLKFCGDVKGKGVATVVDVDEDLEITIADDDF